MKLKETFTVEEEGLDAKDDETQVRPPLTTAPHTLTVLLAGQRSRGFH